MHAGEHILDTSPFIIQGDRGSIGMPSRIAISGDGVQSVLRAPHEMSDAPLLHVSSSAQVKMSDLQVHGQLLVSGKLEGNGLTFSSGATYHRRLRSPGDGAHGRHLRHTYTGTGGGLRIVVGGDVVVNASSFRGLVAASGGAVSVEGGRLTAQECLFADNQATTDGGALSVTSGELRLVNSNMQGNDAAAGGALSVSQPYGSAGSVVVVEGSDMANNTASNGGAIHVDGGRSRMVRTYVHDNRASQLGGGVRVASGELTFSQATRLAANSAGTGGHATFVSSGALRYALPAPLGTWIAAPVTCRQYREPCPEDATTCDPEQQPLLAVQPCPYQTSPELLGTTYRELNIGPLDDDYPYACAASPLKTLARASCQSNHLCPCHALLGRPFVSSHLWRYEGLTTSGPHA